MASREPLQGSFDEVLHFLMYHNTQCHPVPELHSCIEKLVEVAGKDLPRDVRVRHDYFYGFCALLATQEEWSQAILLVGVLEPFQLLEEAWKEKSCEAGMSREAWHDMKMEILLQIGLSQMRDTLGLPYDSIPSPQDVSGNVKAYDKAISKHFDRYEEQYTDEDVDEEYHPEFHQHRDALEGVSKKKVHGEKVVELLKSNDLAESMYKLILFVQEVEDKVLDAPVGLTLTLRPVAPVGKSAKVGSASKASASKNASASKSGGGGSASKGGKGGLPTTPKSASKSKGDEDYAPAYPAYEEEEEEEESEESEEEIEIRSSRRVAPKSKSASSKSAKGAKGGARTPSGRSAAKSAKKTSASPVVSKVSEQSSVAKATARFVKKYDDRDPLITVLASETSTAGTRSGPYAASTAAPAPSARSASATAASASATSREALMRNAEAVGERAHASRKRPLDIRAGGRGKAMRVDSDLDSIVDSEEDDELEARRGIKALTDMKKSSHKAGSFPATLESPQRKKGDAKAGVKIPLDQPAGRVKWTLEAEEMLRAGVAKYGAGDWAKLLTDPYYADHFRGRTNVNLKDKWRNMTR